MKYHVQAWTVRGDDVTSGDVEAPDLQKALVNAALTAWSERQRVLLTRSVTVGPGGRLDELPERRNVRDGYGLTLLGYVSGYEVTP
jgi:hypothetical protein